MNEENTIPPLRTQEQQMLDELRPYLLDPREDYPEPYYMLEYNGVPFSTLGGLQAISGQKKNGKTFVLAQLMAACLGTGTENVEKNLPGLRVPDRTVEYLGHEPRVLYVDTEMEKLNSAKVIRRVHWLCGWDMKEPQERFNVLWLREVEGDEAVKEAAYQKRLRLIKMAIEILSPDIVFIDGVRDIIGDFNDNVESSALIQSLMSLASRRQICIWLALHMNPRPGNDDESKMRGHLGTELGNKVTDTLVSIKKKDNNGVSFTVKQQDARGKDLDDWQFEVTDQAGALGIPKITTRSTQPVEIGYDNSEDIREWIEKAKDMYEWPMSRSDIKKKVFREIGGQKNTGKQQADLIAAINLGYLQDTTIKVQGYPMLMPKEDMPF